MPEGFSVRTQLAVLLVLLADLEVHSPTACSLGAAHHNHHGRGGGPGCAHLAVLNPLHAQTERQRLESIAGAYKSGRRFKLVRPWRKTASSRPGIDRRGLGGPDYPLALSDAI
jgi:hypothetical protein